MPMTSRSTSGEGESPNDLMIHCSFGTTNSRARITATIIQFRTMRIRSTTYAIGSAADDGAGLDMFNTSKIIEYQYHIYRLSSSRVSALDKESKKRRVQRMS